MIDELIPFYSGEKVGGNSGWSEEREQGCGYVKKQGMRGKAGSCTSLMLSVRNKDAQKIHRGRTLSYLSFLRFRLYSIRGGFLLEGVQ